jgi:hypothetical protein
MTYTDLPLIDFPACLKEVSTCFWRSYEEAASLPLYNLVKRRS